MVRIVGSSNEGRGFMTRGRGQWAGCRRRGEGEGSGACFFLCEEREYSTAATETDPDFVCSLDFHSGIWMMKHTSISDTSDEWRRLWWHETYVANGIIRYTYIVIPSLQSASKTLPAPPTQLLLAPPPLTMTMSESKQLAVNVTHFHSHSVCETADTGADDDADIAADVASDVAVDAQVGKSVILRSAFELQCKFFRSFAVECFSSFTTPLSFLWSLEITRVIMIVFVICVALASGTYRHDELTAYDVEQTSTQQSQPSVQLLSPSPLQLPEPQQQQQQRQRQYHQQYHQQYQYECEPSHHTYYQPKASRMTVRDALTRRQVAVFTPAFN
jgi:hypothetical protein